MGGSRVCGCTQTRIDKLPSGTDSTTEREREREVERERASAQQYYMIYNNRCRKKKSLVVFFVIVFALKFSHFHSRLSPALALDLSKVFFYFINNDDCYLSSTGKFIIRD